MGVSGLLKLLKDSIEGGHISSMKNLRAGVDAMNWLYIGGIYFGNLGWEELPHLQFALRMIKTFAQFNITLVFVFDGKCLVNKAETREQRQEVREKNLEIALQLSEKGLNVQAEEYARRAFSVNKEMIFDMIDMLRNMDIEVIVAPGEADPQLAYLCKKGYVDYAISYDSDLICFGCPKVLYQLKTNGECKVFNSEKLGTSSSGKRFKNFTQEQWGLIAVFAGCDYLNNIKGLGIKTAFDLVDRFKTLKRILHHLKYHKKFSKCITEEYTQKAFQTLEYFLHYPVYDPYNHQVTSLSESETPLMVEIPKEKLCDFVKGNIDPDTLENREFKNLDPEYLLRKTKTPQVTNPQSEQLIQELSLTLKRKKEPSTPSKKPKLVKVVPKVSLEKEVQELQEIYSYTPIQEKPTQKPIQKPKSQVSFSNPFAKAPQNQSLIEELGFFKKTPKKPKQVHKYFANY